MMKNRRIILIAFLLCSCMIVGLGYAAYSEVLDISGLAELEVEEALDANVHFESATALPLPGHDSTTNTASIVANNQDRATFTVHSIAHKDEYAEFEFVVINNSETDFDFALRNCEPANEDARNYYQIEEEVVYAQDGEDKILAGGTVTIKVKVTMVEYPGGEAPVSANFTVDYIVSEPAPQA